jgi:hypothetical protein
MVRDYINSLVKTLRIRLEAVEGELDFTNIRTKVENVAGQTDFDAGFDSFVYIVDADSGDVTFNLPDPLEAFDLDLVYTVREIGGVSNVILTPTTGLINNLATYTVLSDQSVTFVSDGDNWWIISTS